MADRSAIEEPIDFVFDEQLRDSELIIAKFGDMFTRAPDFIQSRIINRPVWRNDKDNLPLQAADMLAWHIRRTFYEQGKGLIFDTPAYRILREIPHEQLFDSEDKLQWTAAKLNEVSDELGVLFPYEWRNVITNIDRIVHQNNVRKLKEAKAGDVLSLTAIPASGMKRFQLVYTCPSVRNPHLHRRSGNQCLGPEPASDDDAQSTPE